MGKHYSYSEFFNYFGKLIDLYCNIDDEGKREILKIIENNTFEVAKNNFEEELKSSLNKGNIQVYKEGCHETWNGIYGKITFGLQQIGKESSRTSVVG